ncbi:MAG: hypothetical protein NZM04_03980, partial [Methylacidiphilales bacterium]|nr:hypothetical protein [Candidatus Methylacidiphilales bacterium]
SVFEMSEWGLWFCSWSVGGVDDDWEGGDGLSVSRFEGKELNLIISHQIRKAKGKVAIKRNLVKRSLEFMV